MAACEIDVSDYRDFCIDTWRTARKPHKCCECGSTIGLGERYRVTSGKWDGDMARFKQCEPYARLFDTVVASEGHLAFGQLWEFFGM